MPKRTFFVILLLGCLLLLPGCDKDFMTDKHRLEGVNQAGAECGIVFSAVKEVPEMPDGALLILDHTLENPSEGRRECLTEVYLEYTEPLANMLIGLQSDGSRPLGLPLRPELFFICEQEKIMVAFSPFYMLTEDKSIKDQLRSIDGMERVKEIIISIQEMEGWTEQDKKTLYDKYSFPLEGRSVEDLIFEETRNPDSPYSQVTMDTSEEAIREMLTDSLRASWTFIIPTGFPDADVGQRVDSDALLEGVWRVYCLQGRFYFTWDRSSVSSVTRLLKDDLLYLMATSD